MAPANRKKKQQQQQQQQQQPQQQPQQQSLPLPGSASTTNYREIQVAEVDALRSIYDTDFETVDIGQAAWSRVSNLAFRLCLRANSNRDVKVSLQVELPTTYPKSVPVMSLTGLDLLPQDSQNRISHSIKQVPKALLGNEMIYNIAAEIEEVLEDASLSIEKSKSVPSLQDERMEQENAALRREEQKKKEEEEKRQSEQAESDKHVSFTMNDRATMIKKASKPHPSSSTDSNSTEWDDPETIKFDRPVTHTDDQGKQHHFIAVDGKTLISEKRHKETFTVRPARPGSSIRVPLLFLKEIFSRGDDASNTREKMQNSEEELEKLSRVRHPNIIDFIDFMIRRPLNPSPEDEAWRVSALFELANKSSLKSLLSMVGSVSPDYARNWANQLLEGLEFYHRNGIVHGNLGSSSVLLFQNQFGSTVVKILANVEGALPLPNMLQRTVTGEPKSTFWIPPEVMPDNDLQISSKTDIWDFGITLLEMGMGRDVFQNYTSASDLMNNLDLSVSFRNVLRQIFETNPAKRPTAFRMQAFEFFRSDTPILAETPARTPIQPPSRHSESQMHVRYFREFDELGSLGKGGFGQVVKARNKLDGGIYAIKKIPLRSQRSNNETLHEIMLLSRLNHPYVVRYYGTWIDDETGNTGNLEESEEDEEDLSSVDDDIGLSASESGPQISNENSLLNSVDFVSSKGFDDNIIFAEDSDEEPRSAVSRLSKLTDPAMIERNDRAMTQQTLRRTLYIQMEFCEKRTLRDYINDERQQTPREHWKFFRQILDGLNHIHSHSVIHRDLKPDNIFIDVANCAHIGDFGLAKTGQFVTTSRGSSEQSRNAQVLEDFTRSVGTACYVAPEMSSSSIANYDMKVDMFSLGIIFFEMWFPMPTRMERNDRMRDIRMKNHVLPEQFRPGNSLAVQGEIIDSLLNHDPIQRPSAQDLLNSGKIPLQVEEEQFKKAVLSVLSSPGSGDYKKILSSIFSQHMDRAKDLAWDVNNDVKESVDSVLIDNVIFNNLRSIFRGHGALEVPRKAIVPLSTHYSATDHIYQLLDPEGNVVQLSYDLTLPNARYIAKHGPVSEKMFTFGDVFRKVQHISEPQMVREVDFDIVSTNALDLALREAEILKVMDEIVDNFLPPPSSYIVYDLNHSDILDVIFDHCKISKHKRKTLMTHLNTIDSADIKLEKFRSELRSKSFNISATSLDELFRFRFKDTPANAFSRLQKLLEGTQYAEKLPPLFARLDQIIKYAKHFNVKRHIYINPLSNYRESFFRGGVMFQCAYSGKRWDVFASGGRYDSLIREFKKPRTGSVHDNTYHAVGFTLSFNKLKAALSRFIKRSSPKGSGKHGEVANSSFGEKRCDVLVASFDSEVLRSQALGVLNELWVNDISAELASEAPSLEALLQRYKDADHTWIIIVKHDSTYKPLKVRNIPRKEDYEVSMLDLVSWFRHEIWVRNQREQQTETPTKGLARHVGVQQSSSSKSPEVTILTSQHKSKKMNRRGIVEAAQARARDITDKALDGPIVAIDTTNDIISALRKTRLWDSESWREMIHGAPIKERNYLTELQELLSSFAHEAVQVEGEEKYSNAFVYNFRTGVCILYDLTMK